jgi:hypothetical protein
MGDFLLAIDGTFFVISILFRNLTLFKNNIFYFAYLKLLEIRPNKMLNFHLKSIYSQCLI